ncbi:MAG: ABC-type multidrug transport system permease component [Candidatus Methanohalarchaeum thermophilum]|uniref:ABC-type multidrug transport system permease component n=1 Tax=Methanohalarchaeum thermophilum TaxID=1903181 RepID=A0A1Q6DUF4_METT1|nr:MAG: ABC-type multidrug transport system permease component [Candidatus Methanohalarchaeum thermophilum]
MKTVVLCIDRDNDVGAKTGRLGPIIGVDQNLSAVRELALSDPEDSDVNAIYAGIKVAKEIGNDAVLATITGSENLGVKSDQEISRQIDEVLEKVGANKAIVVTDGAEDENVIPIVESRLEIESIKRVIVRQSQDLETTYYLVKRFMNDPKVMRTFFIPIGLAFLVYSIFNFVNAAEFAISGIFLVIGLYMILRAVGGDEVLYSFYQEVKRSLTSGSISFVTYVSGFIIFIVGLIQGYLTWLGILSSDVTILMISQIVRSSIWWFVVSSILVLVGKLLDEYIKKSKLIWRYTVLPFFSLGAGLVIWGGTEYIIKISGQASVIAASKYLAFSIMGGILISFFGMSLTRFIKEKTKLGLNN